MHKSLAARFILAVSLLLAAGCTTSPSSANLHTGEAHLRYDGLYRSTAPYRSGESPYWYYLRFYPDGLVMAVSTGSTPESLGSWFTRNFTSEGTGRGEFKASGNRVIFSSTTQKGVVDYDGEFRGDVLHFNLVSHINGYRGTQDFEFIPLQTVPEAAPAR